MVDERNLLEEVNELSGSVIAHDVLILHMAKILIAAGAVSEEDMGALILGMKSETDNFPSEIQEGYRMTMEKLEIELDEPI